MVKLLVSRLKVVRADVQAAKLSEGAERFTIYSLIIGLSVISSRNV